VTDRLHTRALFFFVLAAGVSATALVLSGMLSTLERPSAVATAITLDLTVLVPLAYYFLVVRARGWPPVALAPIVVLSLVIAAAILPSEYHGTLRIVEALAVPVEVFLLGWIAWQAAGALRQIREDAAADPVEALHQSARKLLRMDRVADVLASELAVLYYSLGAWRRRPHIPDDTRAFTSHRRSGHGGLVVGVFVVTAAESVVAHVLLARWSVTLAWVVTALSIYGALWLVADFRATVLRPLLGNETEVWIRAGLRWRARIPRDQIAGVGRKQSHATECTRSLAFLTPPNFWIQFSAPVLLEGPYGLRRRVRCLGLFVDEPAELARVLGAETA
jgi:hypothetical protein